MVATDGKGVLTGETHGQPRLAKNLRDPRTREGILCNSAWQTSLHKPLGYLLLGYLLGHLLWLSSLRPSSLAIFSGYLLLGYLLSGYHLWRSSLATSRIFS